MGDRSILGNYERVDYERYGLREETKMFRNLTRSVFASIDLKLVKREGALTLEIYYRLYLPFSWKHSVPFPPHPTRNTPFPATTNALVTKVIIDH